MVTGRRIRRVGRYDPLLRRGVHRAIAALRAQLTAYKQRHSATEIRLSKSGKQLSEEELKAEIDRLRAENESLKKPARGKMSLKVSEKGALSVYGLGRFPVTLYREQWEKLLAMADEIRKFIAANDGALKKKE